MLAGMLSVAVQRLAEAGVDSPQVDAEWLAAHVLGTTRSGLLLVEGFDSDQQRHFDDLVEDRANRIPLQHLTGLAGFRYLELAVGPGVFIPRPETEMLAQWAIDRAGSLDSPVVVELCAGSAAISLSIVDECAAAVVHAVEFSPLAVAWAQRNIDKYGQNRVHLVSGDATDPAVLSDVDGQADLLVCNPPYVPDDSAPPPEVADHDPAMALWGGGADGLDTVRKLVPRMHALLKPGGWVGIEHADVQGESVPAILAAAGGWTDISDHPDLSARPRYTTARRR
ncbi:peptide chain release factor N(5)-glutamine methyltransferase [Fodinicola feengrottensis]|uniref:Release factor glutamine methyltransferase n=1 Tax=Fodinicola feengrottensis TaxID=435914 RepID=A0ABN2FUU6_9ACTN|nr:peptide chain release factor N(5)-glutamine methyltransferase [Fodinicola feengrottensis]